MKINKSGVLSVLCAAIAAGPIAAQVPPSEFVNFEGAQTNPIRISADGTRLFAVNTPNGTLSVFDLTTPSSPALIAEIPVGIEPVSVNINPNVAGNNEAWVVNQISNSVSVVSVSKGIVTNTIYAKAEPSDVVFAGSGLAFVSIARSNLVNVYSASSHVLLKSIPLTGEEPRALAVSPNGSTVYVAFALSGNQTTIVPATRAPAPPPPVNPALPPAPQVGLIIDATNPTWYPGVIKYTMPDNDVAAISTSTYAVNYYSHLGTINLGLAVNPQSGNLYVANTDALNTIMFETALNGHIVNHQITSVNPTTGQATIWDLNPQINYAQLSDPNGLATALAMPTAVVCDPTGTYLYIAAFGTDRVGIFNILSGTVKNFIEIDPQAIGTAVNPASKRGPRGLALNSTANLLYVLNRISNTISIVNLANNTVSAEIATGSFDPTPVAIRNGRGFLYDHKLSGNGTGACASCHIDSEMDLLAWNLGNPDGDMTYLYENSTCCSFHPMKGPMTTQSLRGLNDMQPYHWRGDKPDFAAFNGAFAALLGGSQLSDADMTAFTNFINTIVYQPNPNLNLDGTYPATIQLADYPGVSASPSEGQGYFLNIDFNPTTEPGVTCSFCHASDPLGSNGVVTGTGTNLNVRIPTGGGPGAEQPFKIPHLRNLYQKLNQNFNAGAVSVNGFGFNHDGAITGLYAQASQTTFGSIAQSVPQRQAIDAFEMCFPTGTAPAVGYSRTLNTASVNTSPAQTDWATLQSQALAGTIDLIANGTIQGQVHGLLYQPASNNYATDTTGLGPFTQAQLTAFVVAGDTLTLMGVPPGSGNRMALDLNSDGVKNGDQHHRLATRIISATH
jgi:YVTN family beta-propeller protein